MNPALISAQAFDEKCSGWSVIRRVETGFLSREMLEAFCAEIMLKQEE
jgi:hypothetical protein